jgi:hypothetical protein
LLNDIYFFIITGTSYNDSSSEYYRLEDRSSFDDPILDMQPSEKPDGYSGSEDDSDEDDCDHSHAKKPGILCYIHKLFVPLKLLSS